MLITGLLVLIIAGVGLVIAALSFRNNEVHVGRLILGVVILFIGILGPPNTIVVVDEGTRGVITQFGKATGEVFDPGIATKIPFVQSVQTMDVRIQAFADVPASAASQDLQVVNTLMTLNYSLDPSQVVRVFSTLRTLEQAQTRIIVPAVQEALKASTATFKAEELITRRPEVKVDVENRLRDRLFDNGILLDTLQLTNFEFSITFNDSIEAKVKAEQDAIRAENELVRIRVEAEQVEAAAIGRKKAAIEDAEGAKQANILRAEGVAQAIELESVAQAEANGVISKSLTADMITWQTIQNVAEDVDIIVLPQGQEFIFGEGFLGRR